MHLKIKGFPHLINVTTFENYTTDIPTNIKMVHIVGTYKQEKPPIHVNAESTLEDKPVDVILNEREVQEVLV